MRVTGGAQAKGGKYLALGALFLVSSQGSKQTLLINECALSHNGPDKATGFYYLIILYD